MTDTTITVLQTAGRSLREAARMHKRSERAHRRQAGELMAAYAALEAECRSLGIRLDIEGTDQEGQSHARTDP